MNMWIPHSAMSKAEAMIVARVENNFISTKSSGPVNGEAQDANVAAFKLTRNGVELDRYHAMRLFQAAQIPPPLLRKETYTGRDIISVLLQQEAPINYDRDSQWFSETYAPYIEYHPDEIKVKIVDGKMLSGVLDKRSIGPGASGGIFHLISSRFGPKKALDMIYALQQISLEYLAAHGFTISTSDFFVSEKAAEEIRDIVAGRILESQEVSARLLRGEIVPPIGMTTREFYERQQIESTKTPDDILRPILTSISPDTNGLFTMVGVKSKGNIDNMKHIMGVIGPVTINGERISESFTTRRTSAYFPRFTVDPRAYGYVTNNYINGMNSTEFLFAAMNGRFDLINKALSTATTGYNMRKMIKSLESLIVDNHRAVMRSDGGPMIEMLYGDDALDPRKLEMVKMRSVEMSDADLAANFGLPEGVESAPGFSHEPHDNAPELAAIAQEAFQRIVDDRDNYRRIFMRFENMDFNRPMTTARLLPANVRRLIDDTRVQGGNAGIASSAQLVAMIKRVEEYCRELPYVLYNETYKQRGGYVSPYHQSATALMAMQIRVELSPRQLTKMTPEHLEAVLDSVSYYYPNALIPYGEDVGILASQAISEPLTQYMLDSHHRSVSGGTDKGGMTRVKELYSAKRLEEEASPEMLLHLRPDIAHDAVLAQEVANTIELMIFKQFFRVSPMILFEPFGAPPGKAYPPMQADRAWINEFVESHPIVGKPTDLTMWCFWFEISKSAMVQKSIDLEMIVTALTIKHPDLYIVSTPENVKSVRIRAYLRSSLFKKADAEKEAREYFEAVQETVIRGVDRIFSTKVVPIIRTKIGEDGSMGRDEGLYAIQTVGTNLNGVASNPNLDMTKSTSTSYDDVCRNLGIEAARQKWISELRGLMGDGSPNVRHLQLVADEITFPGFFVSLEAKGLKERNESDTFLQMAMSDPVKALTDAALKSHEMKAEGISSVLMLGGIPSIGSLYNDFLVDEEFVRENTTSVDQVLDSL